MIALVENMVHYSQEGLNEEEANYDNTEYCMCIIEQLNQLAMQIEGAEEISRRGKPPTSFLRPNLEPGKLPPKAGPKVTSRKGKG